MTKVRATVFSDSKGYKGGNLYDGYYYAELSTNPEARYEDLDYAALGRHPYKYRIKITYGGKSVIAYKGDVGRGGVKYRPQIDLHKRVADALGFPGRGIVEIVAV